MKLSQVKPKIIESEVFGSVDFGDLRYRIAPLNNPEHVKKSKRLLKPIQDELNNDEVDAAELDNLSSEVLVGVVLIDMENLTDDDGEPIPFTDEIGLEVLKNQHIKKEVVAFAQKLESKQYKVKKEAIENIKKS